MPYLDAYSGSWTAAQARHLLRRTTFGPSIQMVNTAVNLGLNGTIDQLFIPLPMPAPPVKSIPDGTGGNQLNDPGATYGQTWVNAVPFPNVNPPMLRNRILRSRSKSLYSWTVLQMHYSGISPSERNWRCSGTIILSSLMAQLRIGSISIIHCSAALRLVIFKELTKRKSP
jgi:hypothetical protein